MLCRYADRIAYLAHDAEDALRAGVLTRADLPAAAVAAFGEPGSPWITAMVNGVVDESLRTGTIAMDPGLLEVMHDLQIGRAHV